jgi:hypothetical protein
VAWRVRHHLHPYESSDLVRCADSEQGELIMLLEENDGKMQAFKDRTKVVIAWPRKIAPHVAACRVFHLKFR